MGGGLGSHKLCIIKRYLRLFMSAVISLMAPKTGNGKPFLIPDGVHETDSTMLNIKFHPAEATQILMLWFYVTPMIMAGASVATFQISVYQQRNSLMGDEPSSPVNQTLSYIKPCSCEPASPLWLHLAKTQHYQIQWWSSAVCLSTHCKCKYRCNTIL